MYIKSVINMNSKSFIRSILKKEYSEVNEEIVTLKEKIKLKRRLKDSPNVSPGERLECWKFISKCCGRLDSLKNRRKKLQVAMKEIKCEN